MNPPSPSEPIVVTLGVPAGGSTRADRPRRGFELRPVPIPDLTKDAPKASGVVQLPLHLSWSGDHYRYDLSDSTDRARLYERVLTEGTEQDIEYYVELDLLVETWNALVLPARVREAWQRVVDAHRP